MGYEGPDLAALFDVDESVDRLCRDLTRDAGSHMTSSIKDLTPVGHQPFSQNYIPGHLKASIRQLVTVVHITAGGIVYESGTETEVTYGPYVEEGTGLWGPRRAKYEIRPKKPGGWLRWVDQRTGDVIFAKRVMHPGSPGAHMFAKGAALTEAAFEAMAKDRVDLWAREVDSQMEVTGRTRRVRS